MKVLFCVLNKTEKLDAVLAEFAHRNISGATVVESMGMARLLSHKHDEGDFPFLESLRAFLKPEREKSNVIMTVIQDDQLEEAVNAFESVVGDLTMQDTGVVFSVPIDYAKGLSKIGK